MQVGTPTPTQPISLGATNSNGCYGLFELAFVVALVLVITLPFWGKWIFRPFGSKHDGDD
jgi:hypothetical protein